jgi:hypothetical protein
MGNKVGPSGSRFWTFVRGAFLAVGKSGAASETWKVISPMVYGVIGAASTAVLGIITQAPVIAIAAGASIVFAATAFGAWKVQAILREHRPRATIVSGDTIPSAKVELMRGDTAATPDAENRTEAALIVKAIARADILRRFIPEAEKKVADAKKTYEEWLNFSDEKIWGSGLTSGNHRQYASMYQQWRFNVGMSLVGWRIGPPAQPEPVKPEEVLLRPVRNDRNIYNVAGDMPDEERKLQHRVWDTEARRLLAALDAALAGLTRELGQIENDISKAGM